MRTVTFTFVVALALAPVSGCGLVSDEVIAIATSSDGSRKATLHVINGGATTKFYNKLALDLPDSWADETVLDGELCMFRPEHVELKWEGNELLVKCIACCPERVEIKVGTLRDVRMRYEGFDVTQASPRPNLQGIHQPLQRGRLPPK
jgi:hypothetical protein